MRSARTAARYLARVRGSSIADETGEVAFVRGSTQDITEQRAVEQAMARAEADREAAAREHAIATELQQSLLPPPSFEADELEIATFYRPGRRRRAGRRRLARRHRSRATVASPS